MNTKNKTLLGAAIILIIGTIFYLDSKSPQVLPDSSVVNVRPISLATSSDLTSRQEKAKKYPLAKEIVNPSGFINTPGGKPIALQSLVGKKVVLLDIWTYSCINCQRTLPYLKSWYDKYKDKGLEIIGLSAPEFEFEKDYGNVSAAVKKLAITWPVVLDNNFATARSYGMRYWPEEYLIDIDGFVVHKSVGEGGYEETEAKIQELLKERMKVLGEAGTIDSPVGKIDPAALPQPQSPETYFGAARNQYLGNGARQTTGEQMFILPAAIESNILYLGGTWSVGPEYAENQTAGASIVFKYKAKEVYFVASSEEGARVKIYSDGAPISENRGEDVAADGSANIKEDRLYKLIKNAGVEEHTVKIEMESGGLRAYTFTFG